MTTKGKKKKGQAMSLGEFLGEETATSTQVVRNWAEEMDNIEDDDTTTSGAIIIDRSMLPTAPKAALGPNIDTSLIPKTKPFVAHISNISYEADEKQLRLFFKNLQIESINLPTNDRGSLRGFGSIEFSDRESLIEALGKNDVKFLNRPLKIQLKQEGGDGRHDRHHHGNNHYRDNQQSAFKSDDNDWRRRPSNQEEEFNNNSNKYMNNNYPPSETGSYRGSGGGGGHRGGRGSFNNRNRVYNNNGNNNNNQYDRPQRHNLNSSRSSNRSGGGGHPSSPNEQRYVPRQRIEQVPTIDDTTERQQETPLERPKLILQPRTKPIEEGESGLNPSASSIFGGAKPVDTSARERAIEEKIQSLVITKPKGEDESSGEVVHEQQQDTSLEKPRPQYQRDRRPYSQKNHTNNDDDADSQISHSTSGQQQQRRFSNQSREFVNSGRLSKSSSHDTRFRHDDNTSERSELVEAPPPAVNPWQKRPAATLFSETQVQSTYDQETRSFDQIPTRVIRNNSARGNNHNDQRGHSSRGGGIKRYESDRRQNYDRRGSGRPQRQSTGGQPHYQERKSYSQQVRQPQQYEEVQTQDFNSGNKFATLNETDDN